LPNRHAQNPQNNKRALHTVRRGFRLSVIEGIFAQVYGSLSTIGSGFITKFMVLLGASPLQFSLLSALGQVSAVFQPLGVAFTHRLKRRKWACVWITAAGRFLTFFIGAALLFSVRQHGIWFLLGLLFVGAGLQAAGANIWIAWVSDLVPVGIRGRFFARRNQILMFAGLVMGYLASLYVDSFEKTSGFVRHWLVDAWPWGTWFRPENQPRFLGGMFIFAAVIGIVGLFILARQPERPLRDHGKRRLWEAYREPFRDRNFRLLLFFGVWWMLAIGVGSAFWGPFMLTKLRMGMFKMQLYGSLHTAASLLAFNFWGRFIDRYGNKSAMQICVLLGGLNPMLWLFMTAQNYNILWIEGIISGFMWAGNGVVTTNFVLSIAGKGREQVYSGLYAAIAGVSMMASTLLSGVFYPSPLDIGARLLEPEQVVFGVGGILRWLALIPLAFVIEKRTIPLGKALSGTFRSVLDSGKPSIKT
jgi:MFS family permease